MTMSLGSVGSADTAAWPRLPLTFATLMSALRSNNLAAARAAYDALQTSLQPHVGTLIAPVGAALGEGETAQAGAILGQMRGVIAAAAAMPAVPAASSVAPATPVPAPTDITAPAGVPAASTAAALFDRWV